MLFRVCVSLGLCILILFCLRLSWYVCIISCFRITGTHISACSLGLVCPMKLVCMHCRDAATLAKKSLQPRSSRDWSTVRSCDIMRQWSDLQRELATRRYCGLRQCQTKARYGTLSHDRTVKQPHDFLGCYDILARASSRCTVIARNGRQNPYILIWLGPGQRTGRRRGSVSCTETSPIQSQWRFRSDCILPSEIGTSWCGRILHSMAFVSFCLYLSKKKKRKRKS